MGTRRMGYCVGVPIDVEDPSYSVPRRNDLDRLTEAELAISRAILEVEKVGADPLLTEAVILLQKARDKVADLVDRRQT